MTRHALVRALGVLFALVAPFEFGFAQRMPAAIPEGTQVQVRIIDRLSSENAKAGDTFRGTLTQAIVIKGKTEYRKGADVVGKVVSAHASGRLSDPGELELVLTAIRNNGNWYPVDVQPFHIKGESHTKSNVTKIGGGAAAGALIGAIAGGGKGAAIGAGVGAAGGTAAAAATGRKEAKVEPEAVLSWVTAARATAESPRPRQAGESLRARDRSDRDDQAAPGRQRGRENEAERGEGDYASFSERDRQAIRSCLMDSKSGLPPGLAKRERLPPGLERQLQRNGTLPPGLQKKVQPLPGVCSARLPRLPADWGRVILAGRVILLDPAKKIMDLFAIGGE
jgi:hypothetical protein